MELKIGTKPLIGGSLYKNTVGSSLRNSLTCYLIFDNNVCPTGDRDKAREPAAPSAQRQERIAGPGRTPAQSPHLAAELYSGTVEIDIFAEPSVSSRAWAR